MVIILTPVYEAEFLGFSTGFRPGRGQHDALDALAYGIKGRNVRWILDTDIRSFFETISHAWLMRFVEHRIGDKRVVRLIRKWLKAGVLDGGAQVVTEEGTPQGAVISPLLANIYLHHVYDLWAEVWRRRHASGDMIVVRYADDTVVGFQHEGDAVRFLRDLKERLAKFALELSPAKTRLIAFGKFVAERRKARGEGRPETFDFLGFTHICGSKRRGTRVSGLGFQLIRRTRRGLEVGDHPDDQGSAAAHAALADRRAGTPAGADAGGALRHLRRADQHRRPARGTPSRQGPLVSEPPATEPETASDMAAHERDRRKAPAAAAHPASVAGATLFSSDTDGRSRTPELGTSGSVRGASSNGRPYRDRAPQRTWRPQTAG